jgi:AraC-like DNA-binding protein
VVAVGLGPGCSTSARIAVLAENDRTLAFGTGADRASLRTVVKPRRILIMAFPDCQMLDITGPLQMFAGVNDELGRRAQGQFSPELVAQGIRHHRLSKLAEKIAEGPQENWRTDTLASEAGVSPRSLSRLFRKSLMPARHSSWSVFVSIKQDVPCSRRRQRSKMSRSGADLDPFAVWIARSQERSPQRRPNSVPVSKHRESPGDHVQYWLRGIPQSHTACLHKRSEKS